MTPRLVLAAVRRPFTVHYSPPVRYFNSSARCMVNPLLNLSHFSAAKEAQFFSKERRIPREEFLPHIQLIRSSEVDPFAPTPGATPSVVSALKRAERGQTDMQTAYSIAISNLGQQLVLSRRDVAEVRALLASVHDRYKRDERNSFLIIMTTVALMSFVAVKTNVIADLREYARGIRSEWRGFDWEWLGNPPSYKAKSEHQSEPTSSTIYPSSPHPRSVNFSDNTTLAGSQTQSDISREGMTKSPSPPQVHRFTASESQSTALADRWTPSRLFWASPGTTRES